MPTQEEKTAEAARQMTSNFENLLDSVGPFGLYQKMLCVALVGGSTFICSLTYYTQIMLMLTPPPTCADWPESARSGDSCQLVGSPIGNLSTTGSSSSSSNSSSTSSNNSSSNSSSNSSNNSFGSTACQHWSYNTSVMFPTIASENNWVCTDAWRAAMVHAVFWAGNIVGSWIWGIVSDKLGRRPATLASFAMYAAGGALTLVKPSSMAVVLAVRFLVGSAHHTVTHLPYVLVIEYCGGAYRTYPLLALIGAWALGGVLLPWLGCLVWNWRLLVLISSLPLLLAVLLYRYVPESSCWLMVQGRGQEAEHVLRYIADTNGRQLDETLFYEVMVDKREADPERVTDSLLAVARYPRLLKNMVLVTVLWMIASLCFYGHSQNTANLGSSVFVSYSLGGGVELVALAVPLVLRHAGRRWPMVLFFITSGLCGVLYSAIGHAVPVGARVALGLCGRMLIMGAYSTCLQYGPELFPTVIRGQSLALYETLGGVAIFVSPSVVYLHHRSPGMPLLVIGALSLLGGIITTLLPETSGQHLPQTLADGDGLGRGQRLLPSCITGPQSDTDTQVKALPPDSDAQVRV